MHQIFWCGTFVERHSFCIVSANSPESMRKLCLSRKFPHQEIRWNFGVLRTVCIYINTAYLIATVRKDFFKNHNSITQCMCWVISWSKPITIEDIIAWKVSKYGVFSGPYFPTFGLNTDPKKLRMWTLFTQCKTYI